MFGYKNADTFIIFIEFIEFIMCTIVNLPLRMHRKMELFINCILFIFTFTIRNDFRNNQKSVNDPGYLMSVASFQHIDYKSVTNYWPIISCFDEYLS